MFEQLLLVAVGGAAGSVLRFWAAVQFGAGASTTFWVNITGSFLIGLLAAVVPAADVRTRLLLATGFLGGFTTFSAWQLEALLAARDGDWSTFAIILAGSVVAGCAAVVAGYHLGLRIR